MRKGEEREVARGMGDHGGEGDREGRGGER